MRTVYYQLYTLNGPDRPSTGSEEISAVDDVEAVRLAKGYLNGQPMELWCGKRKVKSFNTTEAEVA